MFTNNGSNKNTSNTTCSKLGLTAKINDLSKKIIIKLDKKIQPIISKIINFLRNLIIMK